MIINLRGTSGSGKSTVVRRVMEKYSQASTGAINPQFSDGRKQPIGYACLPPDADVQPLWIPGHYETACGGCDTLKTVDQVYKEVTSAAELSYSVLFEGLMIQEAKSSTFIAFANKGAHILFMQRDTAKGDQQQQQGQRQDCDR